MAAKSKVRRARFEKSYRKGERVLAKVKRALSAVEWPEDLCDAVSVEVYANGREQGFHLRVWVVGERGTTSRGASFSEHASSDGIAVLLGTAEQFVFFGPGTVMDGWWSECHYLFGPDDKDEDKAVKAIAAWLLQGRRPRKHDYYRL